MAIYDFEPLMLVPTDETPASDVLMAGIVQPPKLHDLDSSDLFPDDHYRYFRGPLGCYAGGEPSEGHPLYEPMQGLRAAYYTFAGQERDNGWQHNEIIRQGMIAVGIQRHLAQCIAGGYDNVAESTNPSDSIEVVMGHIEDRRAINKTEYSNRLDYHVRELALLDRGDEEPMPTELQGIPVISARDLDLAMGNVPESPEVERERHKQWQEERIVVMRKRLVRLEFEYLSAMALTQLLANKIT